MDRRGWVAAIVSILLLGIVAGCGALFARGARELSASPTAGATTAGSGASTVTTSTPSPTVTIQAPSSATPTATSAPTALPSPTPQPTALPSLTPQPTATALPRPNVTTSSTPLIPTPPPERAIPLGDLPAPPILLQGNGPQVYQVVQGLRRHIVDMDTFTHLGYRTEDIVVSEYLLSAYTDGPPITRLLQGEDGRLYWMVDGLRHPISDQDAHAPGQGISPAPNALLLSFPLGAAYSAASSGPPPVEPTPNPQRVASFYHAVDGGPRLSEVYLVGADGSRPRRLTHGHGNGVSLAPAWSADGGTIAYTDCSDGSSGSCAVATIPSSAADLPPSAERSPRRLGEPMTFDPVWSPDGRQIAYWSSHTLRLYVMDAAGADARDLAAGRGPGWTPDGRIAFWAGEKEPYVLSVVDVASGRVEAVADRVSVFDQRYYPWRAATWVAAGNPWAPGGP